jgi:TatD DNase family protein
MLMDDYKLIDTHCHLDFDHFDPDRDDVVNRAAAAGVFRIIVPALDLKNCQSVLAMAERYPAVRAAVGVHPNSSADWSDGWIDELRQHAAHPKVVAIGEIGLDYYRQRSPREKQRRALAMQLSLAHELRLPVILHNRESSRDLLDMLADSPLAGTASPGVLHSFSADWGTADTALSLGFYLGFTGPVTYKKADELRAVVAQVPADRLLVETDAPFLAPQRFRGKRNEPAYVALVAERVAQVRHVELDLLASQTSANAVRLFGEKLR